MGGARTANSFKFVIIRPLARIRPPPARLRQRQTRMNCGANLAYFRDGRILDVDFGDAEPREARLFW